MKAVLLGVLVLLGLFVLGWGVRPPPAAQARAAAPLDPPAAAVPAVCNAVFSENFDSGSFGVFESSAPNSWGILTYLPHSGCCYATIAGGFNCCLADAPRPAPAAPTTDFDFYLTTTSTFTIPANTTSATLSFWWQGLLYTSPAYNATAAVELSANGGASWNTLLTLTTSSFQVWRQQILDVTAYKGVPLLLRIHAVTNNAGPDHYFEIDDIVIDAYNPSCPSPIPMPPTITNTPTRTPTITPTPTRTLSPTITPTHAPHAGQFEDVPPGSTFYTFVECMGTRGIIGGYPCGGPGEPCYTPPKPYFRTNNNVTRGQVSKMVASAAGWTDPIPSGQQTFEDVAPGSTFWVYIEQLAGRGAVGGYPCGGPFEPFVAPTHRTYFRPNNNLTRGQLAKIVSEAAQYTETPTYQLFEDVLPTDTFYLWVERVGSRGIVAGYPCGGLGEPCAPPRNLPYYRPANNVTRGQTAKIVTNTFFPNCQTPPSPTPTSPPAGTPTPGVTTTPTGLPTTATPTGTTTPTASATVTATPTQ